MVDASKLPIETDVTEDELAATIFGDTIDVKEVSYSGDPEASGIYTEGLSHSFGFAPSDTGVILSTGRATDVTNDSGEANQSNSRSTDTDGGIDGDADFNEAAGLSTFDAAFIEATFVPEGSTLTMQFVFGSDEYPEFVFAGFNDTIGVWVNGEQVELVIGQGATSVDAVNPEVNSNLYVDNTEDQFNTEMDGFTVALTLKAPVMQGQENTIKIGIADAGDSIYDSNLLIAANSIQTAVVAQDDLIEVEEDGSTTFNLLANDEADSSLQITQINGQDVEVGVPIDLPSGETITLNEDGTITVEADSDLGANTFSYTVADEDGTTDVAVATVTTVEAVPCFTRGALIDTPCGPLPIETLAVGDKVLTRDRGPRPIRWIGSRRVLARSPALAPIMIRKGCLGADRDTRVSPRHRMLITGWRARLLFGADEVLAQAKDLVDDRGVRPDPADEVEYWHILFDGHEIVSADGVPSESFHPGDQSLAGIASEGREELLSLFPELRASPRGYGPSARRSLKRFEARALLFA